MSDEPKGGVYQPIFPVIIGLVVGLTIGIIVANLIYAIILDDYHSLGNPGILIELVNSGGAIPISIMFGLLSGACMGLCSFLLADGRI